MTFEEVAASLPNGFHDAQLQRLEFAEALRLTRVDSARVAEELLSSLEESDEEVAAAWAIELERRSREIAEGHVQTVSWETARTEILKELERRHAPRSDPEARAELRSAALWYE